MMKQQASTMVATILTKEYVYFIEDNPEVIWPKNISQLVSSSMMKQQASAMVATILTREYVYFIEDNPEVIRPQLVSALTYWIIGTCMMERCISTVHKMGWGRKWGITL
jgi:hypothetical protein